jgi:hypothetical protein
MDAKLEIVGFVFRDPTEGCVLQYFCPCDHNLKSVWGQSFAKKVLCA